MYSHCQDVISMHKVDLPSRWRIHRSTTDNFCLDEIRPRDWLNVDVGIFGHAPSIILSTTTGRVRAASVLN